MDDFFVRPDVTEIRVVARSTDPETSWAAAHDAMWRAESDRGKVYRCLCACFDGLTDWELAQRTGLGDNARKRRSDLKALGFVYDTGERRLSPRGSRMIVWAAVTPSEARAALAEDMETVEVQESLL